MKIHVGPVRKHAEGAGSYRLDLGISIPTLDKCVEVFSVGPCGHEPSIYRLRDTEIGVGATLMK